MDIFTKLDRTTVYSKNQMQLILGAWVMSDLATRANGGGSKIQVDSGHVEESDYNKTSIYSLLYSLYRSMGDVKSDTGERYEFTFNTWGYAWPKDVSDRGSRWKADPQVFGRNAYAGLYEFDAVQESIKAKNGKVHIVEMGCGTGAGAHHICTNVLPECTYEAVDMQRAAIETCRRKFVKDLKGRLTATWSDATQLDIASSTADMIAVCETHVTEHAGECGDEDQRFFKTAYRILKPGGFLVWGNAIPESTWQPCFDFLQSIGMKLVEVRDVTDLAVEARDIDKARIDVYVEQCLETFHGFKIPMLGSKKRVEAEMAMKNFCRHPGTNLYKNMQTRKDTYKVVCFQKQNDA
jgi:SAM-dependent methyltransferase